MQSAKNNLIMRKKNPLSKILLTILTLLFFGVFANAQNGTIKGIVKDINGNPLAGASISIQGLTKGTTTDANGAYSLSVAPGVYKLTISFVGQASQTTSVTVVAGGTVENNANLSAASDLGAVQVVGSRSRLPRSIISTPVPVDIITVKEIKTFAQVDVTQMLNYTAPSFQSARQTVSDGTDHIDPAGLRGLGPDQTLVLLNGKRRHNTALVNINGTVGRGSVGTDMNTIPAAAIERIEVLRDGAAAQYGSDAIAGVINVVLKKKYNGFNVSTTIGENNTTLNYDGGMKMHDGATRQFDFSAGSAGKLGYVNLSGQWLQRERTNRSGNDNTPLLYFGNNGAFPTTQTGVDPTEYRRFLINYDKDFAKTRGYDRHNLFAGQSAATNWGTFLNAGTTINNKTELYLTAGISKREGFATGFSRNPNSPAQQPVVDGGSQVYADGFLPEIHTKINDGSLIIGFKTKLKAWGLDVSETYGKNKLFYNIENTGNASLPGALIPQTKFDAGNLSFSQSTTNIDIDRKYDLSEGKDLNIAFGAELRSEKFDIAAGELNSYTNGGRIANVSIVPSFPGTTGTSPTSGSTVVPGSGSQVFPGFQPGDVVNAKRSVYAAYADLEYTIGKLLLGAAGRFESYKETGKTYNGTGFKLTGRYEFTNNWAFRGSASTGFRAPSLHQRYFQNTSTQFVGGLPVNALTANNSNAIVKNAFGISDLKPEKSVSFTAGFVGKFGNGFTLTVDGYYIQIKDRIVLSTQFSRGNALVNTILNANAVPAGISGLQFWTNAIDTKTQGVDVVLTKRFKLTKGSLNLSIASNFNQNKVVGGLKTNSVIDAPANNPSLTDPTKNPANDLAFSLFDRQQKSRIEDAQPKSKINFTASYDYKKVSFLLRAVRFGETVLVGNLDPKSTNSAGVYWNDIAIETDQKFKAKITTDMVFTFRYSTALSFSIGANNVFDVYPDRLFVDPRNDANAVFGNPIQSALGTTKTTGAYAAARDLTNRGRFLYGSNQFGSNGRYIFGRLNIDLSALSINKKK
jgi:iron complex outermembrane recepter protein